ncbi:DEKNAAC102957 [Brettanomyces naardenensis]|uniref:DEKNAAC102957 n=1 Tax=Brettanomyces naardenensis TaxID=13370 RepID=A0A448YM50_BRENA|nr:DEKNAAC102957 [Brettanomyces naardenensis]
MFSGLRQRFRKRFSQEEDESPFREGADKRKKSRRPPNTAFRQQRLKSWQPILTPKTVLPLLLLLTIICVPIGIGFMVTTYNIQKVEVNYSKCDTLANSDYTTIPGKYAGYHFRSSGNKSTAIEWKYNDGVCSIRFDVLNDIKSPVYLYYKLTSFYQNHRKYVESYDWNQIRGEAVSWSDISSDCGTMRYRDDKIIYPCGLVANSMFNDTFSNPVNVATNKEYSFSAQGIAWHSDLGLYKRTAYNSSDIVPPEDWVEAYPKGYTEADLDALATDERFMNWMRTAALPSFLKMYGINKSDTLPKGQYELNIGMNYPVTIFGGTKSVIISTSSVIGGRNMALGICYIILGGLAVFFMLAFLVKQIFTKKRLNHSFLDELAGDRLSTTASGVQGPRDIL